MTGSEQNNDLLKEFEPIELEKLDNFTQQLVHGAKKVFGELARLIKSITLYGAEHQSSLNFRARFFEVMTQALSKGDDIVVEVQSYALVIADQVIYEDAKVEGNFIYRFYTDGIRSLTFQRGVTSVEIDQLLNIFLLDWANPAFFEDDAVTVMWSQNFEHIKYSVQTKYDEDTQDADSHLFNFTDELNRLSDYCHTAKESITLDPIKLTLPSEQSIRLAQLHTMSKRELLEKLISLTHETQSERAQIGGVDRFVQLLEQLAQLFAQNLEIGELERLMRQAMFIASSRQRDQLIERWAVPIFMQQVMIPLRGGDHPLAMSALSCVQLLGSAATPHIARAFGETAEAHLDTLTKMMLPHINEHPIELCRVIRIADFLHNKRLIPLLYSSQDDSLCLKVFQTGWKHEDQGVRYEVLLNLPERLYSTPILSKALLEGLSDTYSKIRTLSCYRLSKLRDNVSRTALKQHLDHEVKALKVVDLRKLFAALALMGEPSEYFVAKWAHHSGGLKLSSIAGKGREEGHSVLIGLAISQSQGEHQALIERAAGRKLGGALFVEAAQWGLAYLSATSSTCDQMVYELFFRNQLSIPKGIQR
jgi:hypothetical protein